MPATVLSLLLADSRTPSGGYAHSAGLEPAVAAGLRAADVPAFLAARLETVAFVDAAFAAAACAASTRHPAGEPRDPLAELLELDDELSARTPSAQLRAAARSLGRGLLRVGTRLWPGDATLAAYARESEWTPRPVAFGVVARAAGLTPQETARLSLYEDAAGAAAAAVKLLPLDAVDATAWVAGAAERIERLARAACGAVSASALPATATPALDLLALAHHHSEGKLFVS
jgi:urease accessory protein